MSWDPVHDSRSAFLVCLRALCEPGVPVGPLPVAGISEDPMLDHAASILLSLLDPRLGLAATGNAEVERTAAVVRRQTGAAIASVEDAAFVLAGDGAQLPVAIRARRGTPLRPEAGATILYAGTWTPVRAVVDGPGVLSPRAAAFPLPAGELEGFVTACATPPTGVETFTMLGSRVAALPRSLTVVPEAA